MALTHLIWMLSRWFWKFTNYFSIYIVQIEHLKEYCKFVEVYHSKTRLITVVFISWYPQAVAGVSTLEVFLLVSRKTACCDTKFLWKWSEWDLPLTYAFHSHIEEIARENNSLLEVMNCLKLVHAVLSCHAQNNFMSLKVKQLLAKLHQDGQDDRCDAFYAQIILMYTTCLE